MKPLKIYHLTSELSPYVQSTPLSEFSKSISIYLNDLENFDIRTINPKYGFISERKYILREVIRLKDMEIDIWNEKLSTNIKSAFIPNTRSQIYFLEFNNFFKDLPELLYKSRNGRFYKDNEEKFSFFVDWQTSMLPLLLQKRMKKDSWFKNIKTVFFLHNNCDQFNFSNQIFEKLNLEYNKRKKTQNLMELAINSSDFTFVFNDIKSSKIKSLLKDNRHKIVGSLDNLKSSEKLEIFNTVSKEISSLI